MGTGESKYAQTNLCCVQNRKNGEEQAKRLSRSKSRVRPAELSSSIFKIRPEKTEAGHHDEARLEKLEILQESLTPAVLVESSSGPSISDTIPTKKAAMPSAIPDGWTAAQLVSLNEAVHYTASVLRRKSPGFFAVQVDYHLRDRKLCSFSQLIADDACTGSSARPQLSSRLG
jgi:hypothetical protein